MDSFYPLLNRAVSPLLEDLAFIQTDRDSAVTAWLEFKGPLLKVHGVEFSKRQVQGSLEYVIRQLEPLSMPTRERYLFIPCKNNWTLICDNGIYGSDTSSLLYGTVTKSRQRGVRLCVGAPILKSKNNWRAESVVLEVIDPGVGIYTTQVRGLAAQKEGSWHWDSLGDPLPFEDTSAYAAKKIADRFTPEMLANYARAMGIDAFDEGFYLVRNPGAVLLEISHVPFPNQTNRSLADVQLELRSRRPV